MKKLMGAVLGISLLAVAVNAQTNQVLSRNAVGYERLSVPAGGMGFNLVRLDFIGLGGDITISNMLGSQLPDTSKIILFDKPSQSYVPLSRARGVWNQGTTVIDTAYGFFLVGATNLGQTNYPVYLMGEVPDRFTQSNNTVNVGGPSTPIQLSGFPYPVDRPWSNVTLLSAMSDGAKIVLFDGTNYIPFAKARGAFNPALTTNILRAGQGFFIVSTGAVVWTETKPYTWP